MHVAVTTQDTTENDSIISDPNVQRVFKKMDSIRKSSWLEQ